MGVVSCAKNTYFDFDFCCSFHSGQLAALSEERDKPMNHQPIVTKQETRNADDTSLMVGQFAYTHKVGGFCSYLLSEEHFFSDAILQDMFSGVHGMGKTITALERIIDELISRQDNERSIFNERLSIERGKVQSLERERDQLRSQVALLQSKVRTYVRIFLLSGVL